MTAPNQRWADGTVLIHDAINNPQTRDADPQTGVAQSNVNTLADCAPHNPPGAGRISACVQQRLDLIRRNQAMPA